MHACLCTVTGFKYKYKYIYLSLFLYLIYIIYVYVYVPITCQVNVKLVVLRAASWLMSVTFLASALEVVREFRWWFPVSPPGCLISALILGAIAVGSCCFWVGFLVACCLVSARCRHWLWHCTASAAVLLQDLPVARGLVELRTCFRDYHRA